MFFFFCWRWFLLVFRPITGDATESAVMLEVSWWEKKQTWWLDNRLSLTISVTLTEGISNKPSRSSPLLLPLLIWLNVAEHLWQKKKNVSMSMSPNNARHLHSNGCSCVCVCVRGPLSHPSLRSRKLLITPAVASVAPSNWEAPLAEQRLVRAARTAAGGSDTAERKRAASTTVSYLTQ